MRLIPRAVAVLALLAAALPARAEIFVYPDANGVVRFTSAPLAPAPPVFTAGLTAWPRTQWNWRIWQWTPTRIGRTDGARRRLYDNIIEAACERHRVDTALVKAVIRTESDFIAHAVSPKGALGLMQLMPATARRHNVGRVFEPRDNVDGGVRHLRYLLDRYSNNLRLVLAAYNAGEGAVDKYGGVPPYRETQDYVQRVLQYRNAYLADS